jgi:Bacterial PH domain
MKIFKASLDTGALIITIGFTILLVFVLYIQLLSWNHIGNGKYFGIILPPVIFILAYALRPVNYRITRQDLVVHRLLRSVRIPLKNIVSAVLIDNREISWSIRTFGVGGVFGYYGRFRNNALGNMTWYATRKDRLVLVRTIGDEKIILTPDEPGLFIASLKSY